MATGRIGTTPVLQVRWSKAPSAGTTSLSGLDDNSVSLVYSVGYEAVYRNGVLLSRTNDYTATNGTTITLIDATIAGDIIEVFANQTIPLTDTYSQTVSDGRFIKNTLTTTTGDIIYASAANTPARLGIGSTGQVLTVSGGVPAWAAAAAGGKLLQIVEASYGTETNTTSTSYADLGLSASITPSVNTSKVLILGVLNVGKTTTSSTTGVQSRLLRGATEISAITSGAVYNDTDGIRGVIQPFMYLDSPATTSSTTYKVQIASTDGGNVIFNFNYSGTVARCRIFLLEIGA